VETESLTTKSRYALVVLVAINILNFYDRHIPGALAEPIRKEFQLTDTQLGLLGSAFIWVYALIGVPIGRMADSGSRKKILAVGMVVWSALTAFGGFATTFSLLMMSRLGVAIGEAAAAPTGTSLIGDMFPPHKRARALGLFMLGVPLGGALSYFFSGAIAHSYGWRTAMVTAAIPAVFLLPALLSLREPARGASEAAHGGIEKVSIWRILRIPTMWWIIASGALVNFNMYALGVFLPAFLSRVHGLSLRESGITVGIIYAIGGVSGAVLAGRWGDHVAKTRVNGRLQLAAVLTFVAAPAAWFGIVLPSGTVVATILLLMLAYAALNTYYALVYSSIQDIVPPGVRATTMAVYFMAMYLCGASFGPLLTGSLSDRMARQAAAAAGSATVTEAFRAAGLQAAMLVIPILSIGLALVLYAGSRTIAADVRRQHELRYSGAAL
jgi:predicted MFS family arabinose efflux permease